MTRPKNYYHPPRDWWQVGSSCRGCMYLGRLGYNEPCCDYFLETGMLRPDEPTARCSVRVQKRRPRQTEGLYYIVDAAAVLGMAPQTFRENMYRLGIRPACVEGFGRKGFLREDQIIAVARARPSRINSQAALSEELAQLRERVLKALGEDILTQTPGRR